MSETPDIPELPHLETGPLEDESSSTSALRARLPEQSTIAKIIHFAAGFLGWFLINGLVWPIINNNLDTGGIVLFCLLLPANIIGLIFLSVVRKTRWIALGILAAWGINFVLATARGAFFNGICLTPFYLDAWTYTY